jgi:putative transposase
VSRHRSEATPNDAQKLKALKLENARLKRLLADTMLDVAVLKDMASKNY